MDVEHTMIKSLLARNHRANFETRRHLLLLRLVCVNYSLGASHRSMVKCVNVSMNCTLYSMSDARIY